MGGFDAIETARSFELLDREAADDEGFNLPGVEEREQFFEGGIFAQPQAHPLTLSSYNTGSRPPVIRRKASM